jgi:hypothetical protein
MIDGFDIVAIRINQEGGVIAGMITALAGWAIVGAAIRETRFVKIFHNCAIPGLECQMVPSGELALCRFAVGG